MKATTTFCRPSRRSCSAARRFSAVAATSSRRLIAALFLSQLDQFVLALGVSYATRTLVQAAALAAGVALYTVNWRALTRRVTRRRPSTVAPT